MGSALHLHHAGRWATFTVAGPKACRSSGHASPRTFMTSAVSSRVTAGRLAVHQEVDAVDAHHLARRVHSLRQRPKITSAVCLFCRQHCTPSISYIEQPLAFRGYRRRFPGGARRHPAGVGSRAGYPQWGAVWHACSFGGTGRAAGTSVPGHLGAPLHSDDRVLAVIVLQHPACTHAPRR